MDASCQTCPPICRSVFDRVVVSYLIRGMTKVMWTLLPTFEDEGPLTFQLQVGVTSSNDAGDWEDVGLPVTNQYVSYDAEQRVFGKNNWTHYRVQLSTSVGTYVSDPVGLEGVLDFRAWRNAREIIRQRLVAFRVGPGGQEGYLLKRRWTGTPCPRCLDAGTKEVRDPDCPVCYGTGFKCGYYYPVGCVWAEMDPKAYHLTRDENRGTVQDISVKATMVMTDLLNEEDVWVSKKTDDRYYVHSVQHVSEMRGVPLISSVELRPVPFTSVVYDIPIPDQLDAVLDMET